MRTILFYFTGTGNSLSVARGLQSLIPESELVPIASIVNNNVRTTIPKDTKVGVVYPMYCGLYPDIVRRFFGSSDFKDASYVFTVVTVGGKASGNPVRKTKEMCLKAGHQLNASWWVHMPDNYIPMKSALPKEEQERIFSEANAKISVISESVNGMKEYHDGEKFSGRMMQLGYGWFMKDVAKFDMKFTVSDKCTKCGTCARVCPMNNISSDGGRPTWKHGGCEGCLACLQFCPSQAISCGKKTENRERYHHPDVTAKDMEYQKKSTDARSEPNNNG